MSRSPRTCSWRSPSRSRPPRPSSSEPEASLLLEDDVRQAEAEAIADAVVGWLETGYAGSGFLPPLRSAESAGGGGGTGGCEDPPLTEPG